MVSSKRRLTSYINMENLKVKRQTLALALTAGSVIGLASASAAHAQGATSRKEAFHLALLDCYSKLGKTADVTSEFNQLVAIKPNDAKLQYNFGYHLYTMGNTAGAIQHYRKATQLDPSNQDYHGNLGNLLMNTKDFNGALTEYGRAGERFRPQFDQVQKYIQQVAQQRAYEQQMKKTAPGKKPGATTAKPKDDDDDE